jgi:hypothetical protein
MSLEVIELMIKEALRDGEISASEKETILKQGESFGISNETVIALIDSEIHKLNIKYSKESKQKEVEVLKEEREKDKIEIKELSNELDILLDEYNNSNDISGKKATFSKSRILTHKLKRKGEIDLAQQYEKQFKHPYIKEIMIGVALIILLASLVLFAEFSK